MAHLAGVNRGTAYQHFETREKLIEATANWVSDRMFRAVFGDPETIGERRVEEVDTADTTDRLISFAMANPELCRIWLLQLLASPDPAADPFWREYEGSLARFTKTELAQPSVDPEALSVLILAGRFPVADLGALARKERGRTAGTGAAVRAGMPAPVHVRIDAQRALSSGCHVARHRLRQKGPHSRGGELIGHRGRRFLLVSDYPSRKEQACFRRS